LSTSFNVARLELNGKQEKAKRKRKSGQEVRRANGRSKTLTWMTRHELIRVRLGGQRARTSAKARKERRKRYLLATSIARLIMLLRKSVWMLLNRHRVSQISERRVS